MTSQGVLRNTDRRGFSLLEIQVALLLLGIAVAGLAPLVVMQTRQFKQLQNTASWVHPSWEQQGDSVMPGGRVYHEYYLAPAVVTDRSGIDRSGAHQWARRLGLPATIQAETPSAPSYSDGALYDVTITAVTKDRDTDTTTADVTLTPK